MIHCRTLGSILTVCWCVRSMAPSLGARMSCKCYSRVIHRPSDNCFSLAYSSGVTTIVAYPISSSLISGLSFSFSPSAPHPLARHAIQNPSAALHLSLENTPTSISSKIAILRRLLLGDVEGHTEVVRAFKKVANGELRLVVEVSSADVISALVRLKREVGRKVKITILGGHESWLVSRCLWTKRGEMIAHYVSRLLKTLPTKTLASSSLPLDLTLKSGASVA